MWRRQYPKKMKKDDPMIRAPMPSVSIDAAYCPSVESKADAPFDGRLLSIQLEGCNGLPEIPSPSVTTDRPYYFVRIETRLESFRLTVQSSCRAQGLRLWKGTVEWAENITIPYRHSSTIKFGIYMSPSLPHEQHCLFSTELLATDLLQDTELSFSVAGSQCNTTCTLYYTAVARHMSPRSMLEDVHKHRPYVDLSLLETESQSQVYLTALRFMPVEADATSCILLYMLEAAYDVLRPFVVRQPPHGTTTHLVASTFLDQIRECEYFLIDYWRKRASLSMSSHGSIVGIVDAFCSKSSSILATLTSETGIIDTTISVVVCFDDPTCVAHPPAHICQPLEEHFDAPLNQEPLLTIPISCRKTLLAISTWLHFIGDNMPHVMLLTGPENIGKSLIARAVSHRLKRHGRLGAVCFIDRNNTSNWHPRLIIPRIASALGDLIPSFKCALARSLEDTAAGTTLGFMEQFQSLVLAPLAALNLIGPLVIVLDALDAITSFGDQYSELLEVLAVHLPLLPENFRVIVTSRPGKDVQRFFRPSKQIMHVVLETFEGDIAPNLTSFIAEQFTDIKEENPSLFDERHYEALASLAMTHTDSFTWAFNTCFDIIHDRWTGPSHFTDSEGMISRFRSLFEFEYHGIPDRSMRADDNDNPWFSDDDYPWSLMPRGPVLDVWSYNSDFPISPHNIERVQSIQLHAQVVRKAPTTAKLHPSPNIPGDDRNDQPSPVTLSVSDGIASRTVSFVSRNREPGAFIKDALSLALEGVVQSSDVFPPLKSVANGLLFFVTHADIVSSNAAQVSEMYARINGIVSSLPRGVSDGAVALSPAHRAAIRALASDVEILISDLRDIVRQRRSQPLRFIFAKRHRARLLDIMRQLDHADAAFMRTMVTSTESSSAQLLAHVQALTQHFGVSPEIRF